MESQSQNPEFRINPENSHPCIGLCEMNELSKFITCDQIKGDSNIESK